MALENTPLINEINQIAQAGPTGVFYHWRAEIKANGKTIPALKLVTRDRIRDFAGAYSDETIVELVFGLGTYEHDIFPYRENLLVTLYREPVGEVSLSGPDGAKVDSQQLRAVLIDSSSAVVEGNSPFVHDKDAADLLDFKQVSFQLLDLAVEQWRMRSTGAIIRKTTSAEAIRYMLTTESAKLKVDDQHRIKGVDLYPPNSSVVQDHIVIPDGTPVTDMTDMIVNRAGAIYSSGFGYYLHQNVWYVYPLYDVKRYENALRTLTLINVPKNRLPSTERTFRITANQVIALVTGEVRHYDSTENQQLNQGNGVRFADANKIMDDFVTVQGNKAQILRSKNNNEFVSEQRDTGLNNVRLSTNKITSNSFLEASKLARRAVSMLMCRWENSDPDLIFPGMPVKYIYIVEDQIVEAFGTVQFAQDFTAMDRPGFTTQRHLTNTLLTCALNRQVDWSQDELDSP